MMKWVFALLTAVLISTASHAQLVITATTDTTVYGFEQPIGIYITAHNTGGQPVNLQWFTSCQSEYWIDQYYSQTGIVCAQVLTSLTLPPYSSHTWTRVHQSTQYLLTPGDHTIISGVINYGQAQPISIQVEPPIPVELSSFTATVTRNTVTLNWTTATELNNSGFEIQLSIDDDEWKAIAFVEGYGTTTESHNYSYVDDNLIAGQYMYRLLQIDFNGTYEYSDVVEVNVDFTPKEYVLYQNYPNPFNPGTKITYALPQSSKVNLTVYNMIGEAVGVLVDEIQVEGFHVIDLDASNLPSGIYFYRLIANENIKVKKMILLR